MNKQIEEKDHGICKHCFHRYVCWQYDNSTLACSHYDEEKVPVEEMAKVIKSSLDGLGNRNFNFTGDEISTMFAQAIYNAGYRKSTDVAREIFEDIEDNYADFLFDGHRNIVVLTERDFAELKKKYESEGADDEVQAN